MAEGILFARALEGTTQIIKGAATYIKAAEPIIAELKNVKELSRAQARDILLSAQLSMKSPLERLPRAQTIVQQIGSSSMASELKLPVLSQAVKEQFASAIAEQVNQPLTRLLAQRLGKFLSFEAKPGFIELPTIRQVKPKDNQPKAETSTKETNIAPESSALKHTNNVLGQTNRSAVIKVSNMKEFFETDFGKMLKDNSVRMNQTYKGEVVYRVSNKVNEYLKKGYYFYLDNKHFDHIEIFDKQKSAKFVINLNGTLNEAKTWAAQGRKIII